MSQIATTGGSTSTTAYGYDASGDTTARGTGTVGWNQIGKAATVTQGTTSQSNIYNADGALLLQTDTTAGATLTMGTTELHIAAGSSTVTATRTYSRGDTPIAERSTATGSVVQTWLLADKQNTVYGQVNDTTGALTLRRQDPFGNTRTGSSPSWADGHGFLNKIASAATGLTQLGDRLYDSAIGRFVSVDPVLAPLNPQQNDGYSYGANAPTNNTDPTGACYNSETGAFNMLRNCACTNSQNGYQPGANNIPHAPKAAGSNPGRNPTNGDKLYWWLAGFNEDAQGILRTRAHPLQLAAGYTDAFDAVFKAAGTGAQAYKYPFEYAGKSYIVWMWKAEYMQMGYGGEVEFLSQDVPLNKAGPLWHADPNDPNLPKMSDSVSYKGTEIASFAPQSAQVWVGSFNQNAGSWNPNTADVQTRNLHLTATVNFPNAGMYAAFKQTEEAIPNNPWKFPSRTQTATISH